MFSGVLTPRNPWDASMWPLQRITEGMQRVRGLQTVRSWSSKIQRPPNMHQTPEPVRILSWEWTTGISEGDGVTSRDTIQEWEIRLFLPSIRRIYRSIQDVHSKRLCTHRTFLSQVYEHDKQDVCDTLLQESGVVLFSVEIYRHPSVIIAEKWWDGRGWGRCPTKECLLDKILGSKKVRFPGVD